MCEQDRAMWRRPAPLRHCSDGSVSVTLVAEFAGLVPHHDIILQLCPVAVEELLLCLHVDKKRSYTKSRTHLAVPANHVGHVHSWGTLSRRWLVVTTRKLQSVEGVCLPCSRSQTEVVAPLRRFSTDLDVENHIIGILRIFFTKGDSGNASSCADLARSDQNCLDL